MVNGKIIFSSDIPNYWMNDPQLLRDNYWNTVLGGTDKPGLTMDKLFSAIVNSRTIAPEMRQALFDSALIQEGLHINMFTQINSDAIDYYLQSDDAEDMDALAAYYDEYAAIRAPWIEFYQKAVAASYEPSEQVKSFGEEFTYDGVYSLNDTVENETVDSIENDSLSFLQDLREMSSTLFEQSTAIGYPGTSEGELNRFYYDQAVAIQDNYRNRLRGIHMAEDRLDTPWINTSDVDVIAERQRLHEESRKVYATYDTEREALAEIILDAHREWVGQIDESVWYQLGQLDSDGYLSEKFSELNMIDLPMVEVPMSMSMLTFEEYEALGDSEVLVSNLPDISQDSMVKNGIVSPDWSKPVVNDLDSDMADIADEIENYQRSAIEAEIEAVELDVVDQASMQAEHEPKSVPVTTKPQLPSWEKDTNGLDFDVS